MSKKVWQSEYFALNFATGEMERAISDMYFEGTNFEQAQLSLVRSNKPWLRLTGNWFIDTTSNLPEVVAESRDAGDIRSDLYKEISDPENLVKDMSVDDFLDWLNISDKLDDILATQKAFLKSNVDDKFNRLIVGHLKHKYNYGSED